jgi:competence protein ComEC
MCVQYPLILPLVSVVVGILAGRLFAFSAGESAWPALAFLALAALARVWRTRLTYLCIALAMVFVGMFAEAWHRPGPPPSIDAGSRETVILEGCVVEPTVFSADREQFTLELDPGARARVSLTLGDDDHPQRLDYGQRVEIEARVRRPHNYNNPGSFDYAAYLARQYIFWTAGMTRGSKARIMPGRCGSRFMSMVFGLRVAALERIDLLYGRDNYSAGMMEGILIGESSKLEKVWTENFRRTGTFHALVISGVHVTVLAGVLLFLLRMCALPEIPALTVTATAAWLYALVSGLSAPVVRAAGGFTLYLIARFFFRRGRVMNLLAAVALVYLLWDPGQMFDPSFQLSFLCVAAIGALATPLLDATSAPLARGLRAIGNTDGDPHLEPRVAQFRVELRLAAETVAVWTRLPVRWAIASLALILRAAFFAFEMGVISTVVQIGLALPMAEYFHRVSFSGLTANLLIVPLLNGVVPIGFFAIFTRWRWVAGIAGLLLRGSAKVADWHAKLEPSWRVPDPPLWLALALVAALVATAVLARNRTWRWPSAAAVLALFALLLWQPWPAPLEPHTLELTAIDVGQGDSLLVVFPEGQRMVIDGGGLLQFGRRRRSNLDTGEDVVSPYLWNRGIRRLDIVVATHAHEDHSGGLGSLLENFRPRELWVGANPLPSLLERAARFHVRVIEMRAAQPFNFSGASIEVLSPPADYVAIKSGNNDSLALRIGYGERGFLLTGDMERPMEARLLSDGRVPHTDVLKVGHHGSKTSTIQPFLNAVSPIVAIISAGYENSFGHPHKDVLGRLAAQHSAVLRTDLDGLVTIRTDGRRLWLDTMRWRGGSAWWTGEHAFNWSLAGGPDHP